MQLDLVDRGHGLGGVEEILQVVRQKVRDADGVGLAGGLDLLQRFPGLHVLAPSGNWPVDQVEVDPVEPESLQGGVDGIEGGLAPVIVVPELGSDEEFLAWDTEFTMARPTPASLP